LATEEFIRNFVQNEHALYLDLDGYDCGISEDTIFVRDKLANEVAELERKGLRISLETRTSPSYYIATIGLLVMAFYFAVFFMRDALGNDMWILAMLGLFLSPFLLRRVTSGFRIVAYYFALCTIFTLTVGSWKQNKLGSGVIIFFVLGITPYVASRVFLRIWRETTVTLSSDRTVTLTCPDPKARALIRALQGASPSGGGLSI